MFPLEDFHFIKLFLQLSIFVTASIQAQSQHYSLLVSTKVGCWTKIIYFVAKKQTNTKNM